MIPAGARVNKTYWYEKWKHCLHESISQSNLLYDAESKYLIIEKKSRSLFYADYGPSAQTFGLLNFVWINID